MLKKLLIGVVATTLILSTFVGCSNKGTDKKQGEKTKISYMAFSASPDHDKEMKQIISEFEKQNPNIKVDYQPVAFNDYFTKLQTLVASNTAPDTFELNYENFVNYASKGALLNLSEQMGKDSTFDKKVYDKNALDVYKYKDKQYGIASSFSDVVLFYNKDMFDKAGLKYPDEAWTWKDELNVAQKLTNEGKGIWGTYAPLQFWEFYKTIAQNGGSIFNKDQTEVNINSSQNVETLQWMVDKINKYKVTPNDSQMGGQSDGDLFKAGKIGMLRTGIWMMNSFKDVSFKWDIALEPGNTQKAHHFFANGVSVSSKTKNAEAAWKWVKFYTSSKDVANIRIKSNWELPTISDQAVRDEYLKQTPPEHKDVVFKALNTLIMPPVIPKWNELTDAVNKELSFAKLGTKTPKQALDDAKVKIEELMK